MKHYVNLTTIYAITNPITEAIIYVGRTIEMRTRIRQHTADSEFSWHCNPVLDYAIVEIRLQRREPVFYVLDQVPDAESEERETRWIHEMKLQHKLCNLTHGIPYSEYAYLTPEFCRSNLPALVKQLFPFGRAKQVKLRAPKKNSHLTAVQRHAIYNKQCEDWYYGRGPDPGDWPD